MLLDKLFNGCLGEVLYSDDMLLADTLGGVAGECARCVSDVGLEHRLTREVWCCRSSGRMRTRDGGDVKKKGSMDLGASLSADWRADFEVSRRIGATSGDFRTLRRVWAHVSVLVKDGFHMHGACVVSSLTYGLAWPRHRRALQARFFLNAQAAYCPGVEWRRPTNMPVSICIFYPRHLVSWGS